MPAQPGGLRAEASLDELALLAHTAGAGVVGRAIQRRESPHQATYIGRGKVDEIIAERQTAAYTLVIFDDAHSLHPTQFIALQRWLARREFKIARWILTRLDALRPSDVLLDNGGNGGANEPGLKRAREITEIWMQSREERDQTGDREAGGQHQRPLVGLRRV